MDDSLVVRSLQRLGDLTGDRERLVHGQPRTRIARRPLGDRLGQCLSVDELEHEEPDAVDFFEAVDSTDVGVIECGEHAGLTLEPREAIGVARELLGRTLIATSRPSFGSCARYTSPMPPAPSSAFR